MSPNSGSAFAFSRQVMASWVDSLNRVTLPLCVHQVRCFEVSLTYPQFGHTYKILVPQRDLLLFDRHYPETCFVMNIWNIFWVAGHYFADAWPPDVVEFIQGNNIFLIEESLCSSSTPIFFEGKLNLLACDFNMICVNLEIFIWESSIKKLVSDMSTLKRHLGKEVNFDVDSFFEGEILPWFGIIGMWCNI